MVMGLDTTGTSTNVNVESPTVTVNLPEGQPFSFIDSLRSWFDGIVQAFLDGDEDILFALMLSIMFIVAGVMLWRNL